MNLILKIKCLCTVLFFSFFIKTYSQRGLPSAVPTTANVNTTYPQHEDFKESMLSRIIVPKGFKVEIAATGLGKPRMMALTPTGSIYVTRRDQGDVILLNDKNGDGKFDEMKTVVTEFKGVHGILIHDGWLYLCADKELKRGKIKPDGSVEDLKTLINDMPEGGQHPNRTIAFGPDGNLYITVGSDCNDCGETSPLSATILQAKADGSDKRIYARGLRNTIGFDWNPKTKELWGADNGSDYKGDDIPPEELNKIVDGGDYGWPLVYGDQQPDETREEPKGTTKEAYAKTTMAPSLLLPAHSAPINFVFLNKATAFPQSYRNDALLSLHGSWNRKEPQGYKVVRIKFENGKPAGYEDFFSGFLSKDGATRFGRPAGIVVSDKSVYISDDENGVIYKVSVQ